MAVFPDIAHSCSLCILHCRLTSKNIKGRAELLSMDAFPGEIHKQLEFLSWPDRTAVLGRRIITVPVYIDLYLDNASIIHLRKWP